MTRLLAAFFAAFAVLATGQSADATPRERIGYGWLATNDIFGDLHDRWQTGSVSTSRIWGRGWDGRLPQGFGEVLELRFNGRIVSPQNLNRPAPGDRPFGGALSLGLHTHFARGAMDYVVGVDVVVTGPQTGLDDLQKFLHDYLGGRNISGRVRRNQVGNDVNPELVMEAGRSFDLGGNAELRPFVEGRWGFETLARVGFDMTIGQRGRDGLLVRDPVTGQRYVAVQGSEAPGASFVFGADVAYVDSSELLNRDRGIQLTDARTRVRTGVNWQGKRGGTVFYGLTWLGEEFEAQKEGQLVGSVRLRLNF
ncbi:lipid A-modifier LpxR family protein [Roseovarius sp. B08]|uniref:lipid A-modifier LpxR family protein n=1 Tax=Roseovarius sp. B08 TaxID=3449223 RepID=UPI003EDBA758